MPWTLMSLQHIHTHHELDFDVSCTAVIAADMQMQEDKQRTLSGAHEATCSWQRGRPPKIILHSLEPRQVDYQTDYIGAQVVF